MADILGEGDVWAKVGTRDTYWRIVESVLAGVWRLEASTADGTTTEWIEVGQVPQPILAASAEQARATIDIPKHAPQGAMNALPLLAELQERSSAYQPGEENHVINFTLLPITEVDTQVLTSVLGQIPLVIRSGGYGSSRVFATGLRHVWAVQYINSMGNVILDTLEIGGVPVSVLAAREDFEDSAERLGEILEAFTLMSRPFEGSYMGDGSKIADDTRLECGICWWVYDPALGDEDRQIAPGTAFRLLPDTWTLPELRGRQEQVHGDRQRDHRAQRHGAERRECLSPRGPGDEGHADLQPDAGRRGGGLPQRRGPRGGRHADALVHEPHGAAVAGGPEGLGQGRLGAARVPVGRVRFHGQRAAGLRPGRDLPAVLADGGLHRPRGRAARGALAAADALFEAEEPEPAPTVSRRQLLGG